MIEDSFECFNGFRAYSGFVSNSNVLNVEYNFLIGINII